MTSQADRVAENRVRRLARRQGLELAKSHRRDPLAQGYGRFLLYDPQRNRTVFGGDHFGPDFRATLAEAETWLRTTRAERDGQGNPCHRNARVYPWPAETPRSDARRDARGHARDA
jgi:hypothetical protein